MKAIVIGAGRGSRLRHLTEEVPKPLVPVLGRPILDSVLEALAAGGFARKDVIYVCGYKAEVIRAAYPDLAYVENRDWQTNNILLSLLTAREHLGGGFVSTYADIVYRPSIVADLVASPHEVTLACDTDWRRRYVGRSQHPETDAEKVTAEGDRVVRVSRRIPSDEATGEFIGVLRVAPSAARRFLDGFDRVKAEFSGREFREGRSFEKAYLIDYLEHERQQGLALHQVPTHGGYMEIDTLEDASLADRWWRGGTA